MSNIPLGWMINDENTKRDILAARATKTFKQFLSKAEDVYKATIEPPPGKNAMNENSLLLPEHTTTSIVNRSFLTARRFILNQLPPLPLETDSMQVIAEKTKKRSEALELLEKQFDLDLEDLELYNQGQKAYDGFVDNKFNGYNNLKSALKDQSEDVTNLIDLEDLLDILTMRTTEQFNIKTTQRNSENYWHFAFVKNKGSPEETTKRNLDFLKNFIMIQQAKRYTDAMSLLLVTPDGIPVSLISQLKDTLAHPALNGLTNDEKTSPKLAQNMIEILDTLIARLPDFICTEWPYRNTAKFGEHLRWMWPSRGLNWVYWNGNAQFHPLLIVRDPQTPGLYRKFELKIRKNATLLSAKDYDILTNEKGVQETLESFYFRYRYFDIWPGRDEIQATIIAKLFEWNANTPERDPFSKIVNWMYKIDIDNNRPQPSYDSQAEHYPRKTTQYSKPAYNTYFLGLKVNEKSMTLRPMYSATVPDLASIPDIIEDFSSEWFQTQEIITKLNMSEHLRKQFAQLATREKWLINNEDFCNNFTERYSTIEKIVKTVFNDKIGDISNSQLQSFKEHFNKDWANENTLAAKMVESARDELAAIPDNIPNSQLLKEEITLTYASRIMDHFKNYSTNPVHPEDMKDLELGSIVRDIQSENKPDMKIYYVANRPQILSQDLTWVSQRLEIEKMSIAQKAYLNVFNSLESAKMREEFIEIDKKNKHLLSGKINQLVEKVIKRIGIAGTHENAPWSITPPVELLKELQLKLQKEWKTALDLNIEQIEKEIKEAKGKFISFDYAQFSDAQRAMQHTTAMRLVQSGLPHRNVKPLMIHPVYKYELKASKKFRQRVMIAFLDTLSQQLSEHKLYLVTPADAHYLLRLTATNLKEFIKANIKPKSKDSSKGKSKKIDKNDKNDNDDKGDDDDQDEDRKGDNNNDDNMDVDEDENQSHGSFDESDYEIDENSRWDQFDNEDDVNFQDENQAQDRNFQIFQPQRLANSEVSRRLDFNKSSTNELAANEERKNWEINNDETLIKKTEFDTGYLKRDNEFENESDDYIGESGQAAYTDWQREQEKITHHEESEQPNAYLVHLNVNDPQRAHGKVSVPKPLHTPSPTGKPSLSQESSSSSAKKSKQITPKIRQHEEEMKSEDSARKVASTEIKDVNMASASAMSVDQSGELKQATSTPTKKAVAKELMKIQDEQQQRFGMNTDIEVQPKAPTGWKDPKGKNKHRDESESDEEKKSEKTKDKVTSKNVTPFVSSKYVKESGKAKATSSGHKSKKKSDKEIEAEEMENQDKKSEKVEVKQTSISSLNRDASVDIELKEDIGKGQEMDFLHRSEFTTTRVDLEKIGIKSKKKNPDKEKISENSMEPNFLIALKDTDERKYNAFWLLKTTIDPWIEEPYNEIKDIEFVRKHKKLFKGQIRNLVIYINGKVSHNTKKLQNQSQDSINDLYTIYNELSEKDRKPKENIDPALFNNLHRDLVMMQKTLLAIRILRPTIMENMELAEARRQLALERLKISRFILYTEWEIPFQVTADNVLAYHLLITAVYKNQGFRSPKEKRFVEERIKQWKLHSLLFKATVEDYMDNWLWNMRRIKDYKLIPAPDFDKDSEEEQWIRILAKDIEFSSIESELKDQKYQQLRLDCIHMIGHVIKDYKNIQNMNFDQIVELLKELPIEESIEWEQKVQPELDPHSDLQNMDNIPKQQPAAVEEVVSDVSIIERYRDKAHDWKYPNCREKSKSKYKACKKYKRVKKRKNKKNDFIEKNINKPNFESNEEQKYVPEETKDLSTEPDTQWDDSEEIEVLYEESISNTEKHKYTDENFIPDSEWTPGMEHEILAKFRIQERVKYIIGQLVLNQKLTSHDMTNLIQAVESHQCRITLPMEIQKLLEDSIYRKEIVEDLKEELMQASAVYKASLIRSYLIYLKFTWMYLPENGKLFKIDYTYNHEIEKPVKEFVSQITQRKEYYKLDYTKLTYTNIAQLEEWTREPQWLHNCSLQSVEHTHWSNLEGNENSKESKESLTINGIRVDGNITTWTDPRWNESLNKDKIIACLTHQQEDLITCQRAYQHLLTYFWLMKKQLYTTLTLHKSLNDDNTLIEDFEKCKREIKASIKEYGNSLHTVSDYLELFEKIGDSFEKAQKIASQIIKLGMELTEEMTLNSQEQEMEEPREQYSLSSQQVSDLSIVINKISRDRISPSEIVEKDIEQIERNIDKPDAEMEIQESLQKEKQNVIQEEIQMEEENENLEEIQEDIPDSVFYLDIPNTFELPMSDCLPENYMMDASFRDSQPLGNSNFSVLSRMLKFDPSWRQSALDDSNLEFKAVNQQRVNPNMLSAIEEQKEIPETSAFEVSQNEQVPTGKIQETVLTAVLQNTNSFIQNQKVLLDSTSPTVTRLEKVAEKEKEAKKVLKKAQELFDIAPMQTDDSNIDAKVDNTKRVNIQSVMIPSGISQIIKIDTKDRDKQSEEKHNISKQNYAKCNEAKCNLDQHIFNDMIQKIKDKMNEQARTNSIDIYKMFEFLMITLNQYNIQLPTDLMTTTLDFNTLNKDKKELNQRISDNNQDNDIQPNNTQCEKELELSQRALDWDRFEHKALAQIYVSTQWIQPEDMRMIQNGTYEQETRKVKLDLKVDKEKFDKTTTASQTEKLQVKRFLQQRVIDTKNKRTPFEVVLRDIAERLASTGIDPESIFALILSECQSPDRVESMVLKMNDKSECQAYLQKVRLNHLQLPTGYHRVSYDLKWLPHKGPYAEVPDLQRLRITQLNNYKIRQDEATSIKVLNKPSDKEKGNEQMLFNEKLADYSSHSTYIGNAKICPIWAKWVSKQEVISLTTDEAKKSKELDKDVEMQEEDISKEKISGSKINTLISTASNPSTIEQFVNYVLWEGWEKQRSKLVLASQEAVMKILFTNMLNSDVLIKQYSQQVRRVKLFSMSRSNPWISQELYRLVLPSYEDFDLSLEDRSPDSPDAQWNEISLIITNKVQPVILELFDQVAYKDFKEADVRAYYKNPEFETFPDMRLEVNYEQLMIQFPDLWFVQAANREDKNNTSTTRLYLDYSQKLVHTSDCYLYHLNKVIFILLPLIEFKWKIHLGRMQLDEVDNGQAIINTLALGLQLAIIPENLSDFLKVIVQELEIVEKKHQKRLEAKEISDDDTDCDLYIDFDMPIGFKNWVTQSAKNISTFKEYWSHIINRLKEHEIISDQQFYQILQDETNIFFGLYIMHSLIHWLRKNPTTMNRLVIETILRSAQKAPTLIDNEERNKMKATCVASQELVQQVLTKEYKEMIENYPKFLTSHWLPKFHNFLAWPFKLQTDELEHQVLLPLHESIFEHLYKCESPNESPPNAPFKPNLFWDNTAVTDIRLQVKLRWMHISLNKYVSIAINLSITSRDLEQIARTMTHHLIDVWVITGDTEIVSEEISRYFPNYYTHLNVWVPHPAYWAHCRLAINWAIWTKTDIKSWSYITVIFNNKHLNLINIHRIKFGIQVMVNEKATLNAFQVIIQDFPIRSDLTEVQKGLSNLITSTHETYKELYNSNRNYQTTYMNNTYNIMDTLILLNSRSTDIFPLITSLITEQKSHILAWALDCDNYKAFITTRVHYQGFQEYRIQFQRNVTYTIASEHRLKLTKEQAQELLFLKRLRYPRIDDLLMNDRIEHPLLKTDLGKDTSLSKLIEELAKEVMTNWFITDEAVLKTITKTKYKEFNRSIKSNYELLSDEEKLNIALNVNKEPMKALALWDGIRQDVMFYEHVDPLNKTTRWPFIYMENYLKGKDTDSASKVYTKKVSIDEEIAQELTAEDKLIKDLECSKIDPHSFLNSFTSSKQYYELEWSVLLQSEYRSDKYREPRPVFMPLPNKGLVAKKWSYIRHKENAILNAIAVSRNITMKDFSTLTPVQNEVFKEHLDLPLALITDELRHDQIAMAYIQRFQDESIKKTLKARKPQQTNMKTKVKDSTKDTTDCTKLIETIRNYKDLPPELTARQQMLIRSAMFDWITLRLKKHLDDYNGPEYLTQLDVFYNCKKRDKAPDGIPIAAADAYRFASRVRSIAIYGVTNIAQKLIYKIVPMQKDEIKPYSTLDKLRVLGMSSITARAYEKVLLSYIKNWKKCTLRCASLPQFGFHEGPSQLSASIVVQRLINRLRTEEKAQDQWIIQLDIKKAFDSLSHETIYQTLYQKYQQLKVKEDDEKEVKCTNIDSIPWRIIILWLMQAVFASRLQLGLYQGTAFNKCGLIQGSQISSLLFTFVLKRVLMKERETAALINLGRMIMFADDIMIHVTLRDVPVVITYVQRVLQKAGLHLNLEKTKILINPREIQNSCITTLQAKYKWLNISEWIGHPISFSKDLQLIALRKHLMDFSFEMRQNDRLKIEVKIPAINNECIRLFVPLIMTNMVNLEYLDRLYSEVLTCFYQLPTHTAKVIRFLMPYSDVIKNIVPSMIHLFKNTNDDTLWPLDLLQILTASPLVTGKNLDAITTWTSIGSMLIENQLNKKPALKQYWDFDMINIYLAVLTNDFKHIDLELDDGRRAPKWMACKEWMTPEHRLACEELNFSQYQIGHQKFFQLYAWDLQLYVNKVQQLAQYAKNSPQREITLRATTHRATTVVKTKRTTSAKPESKNKRIVRNDKKKQGKIVINIKDKEEYSEMINSFINKTERIWKDNTIGYDSTYLEFAITHENKVMRFVRKELFKDSQQLDLFTTYAEQIKLDEKQYNEERDIEYVFGNDYDSQQLLASFLPIAKKYQQLIYVSMLTKKEITDKYGIEVYNSIKQIRSIMDKAKQIKSLLAGREIDDLSSVLNYSKNTLSKNWFDRMDLETHHRTLAAIEKASARIATDSKDSK